MLDLLDKRIGIQPFGNVRTDLRQLGWVIVRIECVFSLLVEHIAVPNQGMTRPLTMTQSTFSRVRMSMSGLAATAMISAE